MGATVTTEDVRPSSSALGAIVGDEGEIRQPNDSDGEHVDIPTKTLATVAFTFT